MQPFPEQHENKTTVHECRTRIVLQNNQSCRNGKYDTDREQAGKTHHLEIVTTHNISDSQIGGELGKLCRLYSYILDFKP